MLQSMKDLLGYKIQATDGDIGEVDDLLFDDEQWTLRYLVVNTGTWLSGRQVLLAANNVKAPERKGQTIPVRHTRDEVENAPGIDDHLTVSREMEAALHQHFQWVPYWAPQPGLDESFVVPPATDESDRVSPDEVENPHLRSLKEVAAYNASANGVSVGHVDDFMVDDQTWRVRWIVLDTGTWLSTGEQRIISTGWVRDIEWGDRTIDLNIDEDMLRNGPPYDALQEINDNYENLLTDYYGEPESGKKELTFEPAEEGDAVS